jgi:hypothetical protein
MGTLPFRSFFVAGLAWSIIPGVGCGGGGSAGSDAGGGNQLGGIGQVGFASGDSMVPGGGPTSGVFDCVLVTGSNCWKTVIAAAEGCLPPSSAQGKLSADGKTCTYASGSVVTFASPLILGPMGSGIPAEQHSPERLRVSRVARARCLDSAAERRASAGSTMPPSAATNH